MKWRDINNDLAPQIDVAWECKYEKLLGSVTINLDS